MRSRKPYLERYKLAASEINRFETCLFKQYDPENPFDYEQLEKGNWYVNFKQSTYQILSVENVEIDFAFTDMPIYSLARKTLKNKIDKFFDLMTKLER